MYATHGERKSVVPERFKNFKNKILNTCFQYQQMCKLIN